MSGLKIGVLHPGAMGESLAATAKNTGHQVYWASAGRSDQTRLRAKEHDLQDAGTVEGLSRVCPVIVSVCPPHAAEAVASQVLESGFKGLYLDANAISPERAKRLGGRMAEAGISFVDGGIIGGPAWEPKTTYLYLSGEAAPRIASCFSAGPLETCILGDSIGRASALKMCYAAYTKGTTALLCAVLAAAEALEIRDQLEVQWSRDGSERPAQANERARRATAKAWRFVGEMHEIAMTLSSVGLPGGFHSAAGEIYDRMAHFKGETELPALEEVLRSLIKPVRRSAA
jgi:3-hydroxyisobutyrate dehydrogenase-like beta-hydroxyacid dehydrogenase